MTTNNDSKRDIVIYLSAGAMSGIFHYGFLAELEKNGLKDRIYTMYGISSGSLAALYFLSNQTEEGAKLYYEDLNGDKYIRLKNLPKYFFVGLSNYLLRTKLKPRPLFDIDLIEQCITSHRKVNLETYYASDIPLYMAAYNLDRDRYDYLEIKTDSDYIPMLRATGGGQPGYHKASTVNGMRYVDGGTVSDRETVEYIITTHPDKQIIFVICNLKPPGHKLKKLLRRLATALLSLPYFGIKESFRVIKSDSENLNTTQIERTYPNVAFIISNMQGYSLNTNADVLKKLMNHGREKAKQLLQHRKYR